MDEFKEEREAIKSAPFSKKVEYFWDYYRIHTIAAILIVGFIGSFIYTYATKTDTILYGTLINCSITDEGITNLENAYYEAMGTDLGAESITLDTSMYLDYITQDYNHSINQQKLVVLMAAGEIDFYAGDEYTIAEIAYDGGLVDLRTVLSNEEIAMYEEYFMYIDEKVVEEIELLMDDTSVEYVQPELSYGSAEDMESPVPVAIYIQDNTILGENVTFIDEPAVIGISPNSSRIEETITYLNLLLEIE